MIDLSSVVTAILVVGVVVGAVVYLIMLERRHPMRTLTQSTHEEVPQKKFERAPESIAERTFELFAELAPDEFDKIVAAGREKRFSRAEMKSTTPLIRSDIMIEYGSVEIGGKAYVCPLKSVSISKARSGDGSNEMG